jgi:hypothetical protein
MSELSAEKKIPLQPATLACQPGSCANLAAALKTNFPELPAIGLVLCAEGSYWQRWTGKELKSHDGSAHNAFEARFFRATANQAVELRWRDVPGQKDGSFALLTLTLGHGEHDTHPLQQLLEGTAADTRDGFVRLGGGASAALWIPTPENSQSSDWKNGTRIALKTYEVIGRGPQGNAEIVDMIWAGIEVAKPPKVLPGQKGEK